MSSAPSPSRTGAVRSDQPHRRRRGGLLWLLLALLVLALIALALGLYFGLRGGDTSKVGVAAPPSGAASIDSAGDEVVREAVQTIRSSGARQVQVTGYTDVVGGTPVNDPLSKRRAASVATALRSQLGTGYQISTAARGQADPVVPNDTYIHRQLNRRATISTR